MQAYSSEIQLSTGGNSEIHDITEALQRIVNESGIQTGQATAMVVGSTAALSTLEFEPGLVKHDIAAALERIASENGTYEHEKTWNDDNGHSHVRATLIGPSLAMPIVNGCIPFGTWQQAVLIDCDTRGRKRTIVVTVVGK
ncbi:MAG: secondary thiamine-phosphate synthase enzyme YjbQ [Planctomycetota bacterium]|nr:secondary thiamine-phosphate synthase enzyme YjbQ [Planctomycetota bacterium]MDA1137113.1 secondary thiamine-phosphate synthase enzyme YjbQ [Planctomycetota bacterium]